MKPKLFFSLAAMMAAVSFQQVKATVHTVCNYPLNVAEYNTLQLAANASSSGDTLLVQGSNVAYEALAITDKKLIIIGPGWAPARNIPAWKAKMTSISLNGTASSGTEIQGLYFVSGAFLSIQANVSINNIRLIRNYFEEAPVYVGIGNSTTYSDYTIEGNYFQGAYNGSTSMSASNANSYNNFIIRNNVFSHYGVAEFANCFNFILDHNLFYSNSSQIFNPFWGSAGNTTNFTFQNNIFCSAEPVANNTTTINCTFKNNITFNCLTDAAPWTKNGNSNEGGNVWNADPQMADQSAVNAGTVDPFLNFTIASGPANNSGSDGKDMGVLFDAAGRFNWNNSRTSRLPYIFNLNIANNTIEPNTNLNVSLEARRNN